ncbi:hypothetical protein [Novosphingobium mangrovi (ex Huang et al. 2023)]|uniref:Uncharacterized protein n=1 Tax=Novosphingobium mangrovi (ex Huang et al. 2023) TaxID=2976432 RepID=A0ABT2I891_9SPHN|nr:hypothetical protein [Novosphingobium mangrovi (ex Huang et al. 2023)]MCT2401039.1 hypothetical protein [Novosphingobium mangrovi (ex Huang et al. 2023)]
MSEIEGQRKTVEHLPSQKSNMVSEELTRILAMLRDVSPRDARITFEFDGKLRVHIDVRNGEDVVGLEKMLPTLAMGMFHDIDVGATPHHPFFHRISAVVDR